MTEKVDTTKSDGPVPLIVRSQFLLRIDESTAELRSQFQVTNGHFSICSVIPIQRFVHLNNRILFPITCPSDNDFIRFDDNYSYKSSPFTIREATNAFRRI